MFIITLETHDPYFNLAIEEVLLKNSKEEYLILGINDPSVIIGKHQSPHREINTKFVTINNIPVIRRISGGGTVFHDDGNLNFTFISESEPGRQVDFQKYTRPVIDFLSAKGVKARFEGKSDLKIDGFKISGNAEHVHRNRVLHHGTLLFSASLDMLRNVLRKDTSCYISRAVASNPSPVANLKGMLDGIRDINELRLGMKSYFLKNLPGTESYDLSHGEYLETVKLADSKYRSWEWNWAYGPEYRFVNSFLSGGRSLYCRFDVKDGLITGCELAGTPGLSAASRRVIGQRHMVEDLKAFFSNEKIFFNDEEIFNFF